LTNFFREKTYPKWQTRVLLWKTGGLGATMLIILFTLFLINQMLTISHPQKFKKLSNDYYRPNKKLQGLVYSIVRNANKSSHIQAKLNN